MRTAAILPVKRFSTAKQRLGTDVAESLRAALAKAMVGDVLSALRDCSAIDTTIVVTCEPSVAVSARYLGATVVEDTAESGQSAAAALGLKRALEDGFERALCVPGDCPALDPEEIARLLQACPDRDRPDRDRAQSAPARITAPTSATAIAPEVVIVPDRHSTGTNGLLLTPPDAISPSFGPDSRARHEQLAQAAPAHMRVEQPPSLLLDIDTAEDLAVLRERLDGEAIRAPRTRAVLSRSRAPNGSASRAA